MQKQYWILSLVIGLSAITQMCCGDYWGRLVKINNNTSYPATVISSDTKGDITYNNQHRNIQQEQDVSKIKTMDLAIPQQTWDGNAEIVITVKYSSPQGQPYKIQYVVTDRDGSIQGTYETFKWGKTGGWTGDFDHRIPIIDWIPTGKPSTVFNKAKYSDRDTQISITISNLDSDGVTAAVVN